MGLRFLSPDEKGDYQRPNTSAPFDPIDDPNAPRPRRKSTVMLVPPTAGANKGKVQRWISAPYEYDEVSLPSLRRFANVLRTRSDAARDAARDASSSKDINMSMSFEDEEYARRHSSVGADATRGPSPFPRLIFDCDSDSSFEPTDARVSKSNKVSRLDAIKRRFSRAKRNTSNKRFPRNNSSSDSLNNNDNNSHNSHFHSYNSHSHSHSRSIPLSNTSVVPDCDSMDASPPVINSRGHSHPQHGTHPDRFSAPLEHPFGANHRTTQHTEQLPQQDLVQTMEQSIMVNQQVAAMQRFNHSSPLVDQALDESTSTSPVSHKVSAAVNVFESLGGSREISSSSLHTLGQFDTSYVHDQIAIMERFKNALDDNSSQSSDDSLPMQGIPQVSLLENWSDDRDDSRLDVFESTDTIPVREILPSQIGKGSVGQKVAAMEKELESAPVVCSRTIDVHKSSESSPDVPVDQQDTATEASRNSVDVQTESKTVRSKNISVADKVGVFESKEASIEAKPACYSPPPSAGIADKMGIFESLSAEQPEAKSNHSSPSNSKHVADKVGIFESLETMASVPSKDKSLKSPSCSSIDSNHNGRLATIDELNTIEDHQAQTSSRSHMDNFLNLKLASIDRAIKGRDNPNDVTSGTSQSSQSRQYGLLDTTYVNQQIAAMERLNTALVNQLNKAEGMDSLPPVPEDEEETVKRASTDALVDLDKPEPVENFEEYHDVEKFPAVDDDGANDSKSIPLEPASHSSLDVLPAISCADFQDKSSSSVTVDSNPNHKIIPMDEQSQLNPVSLSSRIDVIESLGSGSYNLESVAKAAPAPSNDDLEIDSRSARSSVIEEDLYHEYGDEHPPYSRGSVTPVYLDPFSAEEPSMLANGIPIFIPEMKTVHFVETPAGDPPKLPTPPAIIASDTRYLQHNLSGKSVSEVNNFADTEKPIRGEQSHVNKDLDLDCVEPTHLEDDAGLQETSRATSDIVNLKNISSPVDQEDVDDEIADSMDSCLSTEQTSSGGNSPKDAKSERTSSSTSSRVPVPLAEYMNRKHKPDEAPPPSPTNSDEDPMDVDLPAGVPTLDSIKIAKDPFPAKARAPEIVADSVKAASPSGSYDIFPKSNGPRVSQDLKSATKGTPWRRSSSRGVLPARTERHSLDRPQEDSVVSGDLPADFRFAESDETEADDCSGSSSQDSRSFAITTNSVDSAVGRILRAYRFLDLRGARKTHLCGEIDLFYSERSNPGWEVTYNLVTSFVSNLLLDQDSGAALHKAGIFDPPEREEICKRIEKAWRRGYNPEGAQKHGRRLVGKRAYIGAPEITAFLVSGGVGARERSFDTDNSWTRRAFFVWVYSHFQSACADAGGCAMHTGRRLGRKRADGTVIPPLLVQWSDHVVLVIGAEKSRKGDICLLVLEPSAELIDKLKYRSVKARMATSRRAENHPTWAESNEFHVVYIDSKQHDPVTKEEEEADSIAPIRSRASSNMGTVERRISNRKSNGSSLSMTFGWFRSKHNRIE